MYVYCNIKYLLHVTDIYIYIYMEYNSSHLCKKEIKRKSSPSLFMIKFVILSKRKQKCRCIVLRFCTSFCDSS